MTTISRIFLAGIIPLFSIDISHGRLFRNKDGREIDAEIRSVRGEQVELKVRDKLFVFPIDSLSEEDQTFVREWAASNRTVALDFRTRTVEDTAKRSTQGGGKDKTVTRSWRYETTLNNRSGEDLKALEVKYNIVVRHTNTSNEALNGKRSEDRVEIVAGSDRIPEIANTASATFLSAWLPMKSRDWEVSKSRTVTQSDGSRNTDYYWDDYSSETQLDGIWVKIFESGRQISEWKSEGKLIKEVEWSDQSKAADSMGVLGDGLISIRTADGTIRIHPDLPPVPPVPASKKGDPVVENLVSEILSKNATFTTSVQRGRKNSDLRRLKSEFEELLAKYRAAIGNAPQAVP